MRKFLRQPEPDFLSAKWQEWGRHWEQRRAEGADFRWPQVAGKAVNHHLLPPLKDQVQDHCSFCDNYPVAPASLETIEHFRPKAAFPREAFHWLNLYFCCNGCQVKEGAFDERVLRPDADDYSFERYFRYDNLTGQILPNEQASDEERARAELTLRYFRLNRADHARWRRLAVRERGRQPDLPMDECRYRFLF